MASKDVTEEGKSQYWKVRKTLGMDGIIAKILKSGDNVVVE